MVMEKTSQTEIRCCHLHQTDFRSSHWRSQKTRNSKGFCEDNSPSVNVRAEQSQEGRDRPCFQFRYMPLPCRQTILICLPKSMMVAVLSRAPRQSKITTHNSNKKRMLLIQAASSDQLFGSVLIHFQQDLEQPFLLIGCLRGKKMFPDGRKCTAI